MPKKNFKIINRSVKGFKKTFSPYQPQVFIRRRPFPIY